MNKLISKIVGVALGLTLATGVGAGIVLGNKDFSKAEAAYTVSSTAATSVTSGHTYVVGAANSANDSTVYYLTSTVSSGWGGRTNNVDNAAIFTASATGTTNFGLYYTSGESNYYLTPKTGNSNNFLAYSTSEKLVKLVSNELYSNQNNYYNLRLNGTSGFRWYGTSNNGGTPGTTGTAACLYEVTVATTPTLSAEATAYAKIGSNSFSVAYSNFGSTGTISALSSDNSIATVTASVSTSGSTGTATFTITGVAEGTATITFSSTGASSISTTVTVYEQQAFTKLFKAGKIVSGSKVLIAKNGSSTIMSNGQGSSANNRGTTTATPAGESDYSTLTTCNDLAGVFTITAGTGTYANYYLLYDTDNSGYLEWYSSKLTIYNTIAAACYWSITIDSNGIATIANYSASTYSIKHNNSGLFSCYNAATQNDVSLYELSSDIPQDVALTSITATGSPSVEVGSSITFNGTYSPANATEGIEVTLNSSYATAGEVIMSNGAFTVEITGVAATTGTSLGFSGEDGHGSASVTLVVTSFVGTHTKITTASGLYNGVKVILGNFDSEKVGAAHTGGNNMPTAAGSFSSDGSMLSNSSNNGCEYTLWYLTINDSDDNAVSGWAFYDNGYYLACGTSGNNYWKQNLQLTSLCLFNISFEDGVTSIIAADTHVQRGTVCLNGSIISAYASLGSYGAIDLYAAQTQSDSAIASGYEDFFLMMDMNLSSHGYCSSKGWYSFAKAAWNNDLDATRRGYVSSEGKARLAAWAAANGDTYDGGTGALSARTGFETLDVNNNALIIVVITAFVSVTFIGGYFFLRKKKEN